MPNYTELRLVFEAINGRQCDFNWLLTDVVASCEHFDDSGLFDWGVLSGFPPTVTLELTRLEVEPYADGNPGFWVAHPEIQHPLAEVEIVCWDSSATMLLYREVPLARRRLPAVLSGSGRFRPVQSTGAPAPPLT